LSRRLRIALALAVILLTASEGIGGLLVTMATWKTPVPQFAQGGAVFYSPGVMETQFVYRGWDPTPYLDGVAMLSPANIGDVVWLKRICILGQSSYRLCQGMTGEWEGPFLVVDCSMRGDFYSVAVIRREIVEVGWKTAKRWGMGPFDGGWRIDDVAVWIGDQPPRKDQADDTPIDYRAWVIANTRLEKGQ